MYRLTEVILNYTNQNLDSEERKTYVHMNFISHIAPEIKKKNTKTKGWSYAPQKDLIKADFKVFKNRGEEKKSPK